MMSGPVQKVEQLVDMVTYSKEQGAGDMYLSQLYATGKWGLDNGSLRARGGMGDRDRTGEKG